MRRALVPLALALWLFAPLIARAQGERIELLVAEGVIDSIMSRFIARGIAQAEQAEAQCLIIQLDTPGGLDSAMREIVQKIMGARVPVVVYVAPEGARAASAGVFITLAAHVAAMAPATDIGAAHPVSIEGELPETMETKVVNEAASYIRTIAERRGRNVQWAEDAVRKSLSLTAQEALKQGVIDLVASDLEDLLRLLDGREVETAWGRLTLKTAGAEIHRIEMSFPERFIHRIIDPNIAYILFTLGVWGIIAEFYHPGAILPGLTGAILLILAFIAFGSLPVNWGGIALIILAVILFILDIKVSGFVLSVFGGIAFALGSLLLFRPFGVRAPALPELAVNPWLVAGTTLAIGAFFIFVIAKVVQIHRERVTSGVARVFGARGLALTDLNPRGVVWAEGEEWSAEALDPPIAKGEEVRIVEVQGLTVKVARAKEEGGRDGAG
ncbi:MAG: nodulation protein NfeD [Candidatus Acetothermia bacterium]|jgi:membrane-bound serine protease (ClpP class)|nr:nodulation protein NfeD [Candidatus Acetothermia bacterium]MDH7505424.1 nodulation protein NfeD [Candidatus Acetothermia bacterium]